MNLDMPFLYSQDLSNCTTYKCYNRLINKFLYSQDLSNCTTECHKIQP